MTHLAPRLRVSLWTLLAAALLVPFTGCTPRTAVTPDEALAVNGDLKSRTYYLASSMYYSDFFEDPGQYLVNPYPPEQLEQVVMYGSYVRPKQAWGILPAGTPVQIEAVEFPFGETYARRPIMTPRWFPWVRVRLEKFSGGTFAPKPMWLVVELGTGEPVTLFNTRLASLLTATDPGPEIAGFDAEVRRAIAEKRVATGMTSRQVELSLGPARQVAGYSVGLADSANAAKDRELWRYPGNNYYLLENRVLQNSEPLEPEAVTKIQKEIADWQAHGK